MPVIVAVAAASAMMQYYNSQKAAGAAQERLNDIAAAFNNIVPPQYNIKVWDDPALVGNIPPAAFNTAHLTPEDYKQVGQYIPEVAQFVKQAQPELIQNTQAGKEGQAAQLDALSRYKQIASGGTDPQLAQAQQQASDQARQEAQSRTASTLEAANRRGQLNSGVAMAAQLQGNSDAMQRGAMMSQQAATDAYKNRLQALSASAQLGGQIQSADTAKQASNADILNSFNTRTSQAYQQYLQQRANEQNQAQMQNLGTAQRISDANVANRNQSNQQYQQMQNDLAAKTWAMQNQNRQNTIAAEQYKNSLMGQKYNDAMSKAAAQAGVGYQGINYMGQATQAQNQAIQGLGSGVMAGYMYNDYQNRHPMPVTPETGTSNDSGNVNPNGFDARTAYNDDPNHYTTQD